MDDTLSRFVPDLVGRIHGPFSFRFVLQPVMAMIYAVVDGLADWRSGRPPYFWTMFTQIEERRRLITEGWHRVARVVTLGVVMDVLYQLIVFRWIYPTQLVVVVLGLAFLPYVLLRGPVSRLAGLRTRHLQPDRKRDDASRDSPAGGKKVA
jgi:hypothetical protein